MAAATLRVLVLIVWFYSTRNLRQTPEGDEFTVFKLPTAIKSCFDSIFVQFNSNLLRSLRHGVMASFQRSRFSKSRILYYSKSVASFNCQFLRLCGDINPNPGPRNPKSCSFCTRTVAINHRALECACCFKKCHLKCCGITVKEFKQINLSNNYNWTCPSCVNQLRQLPFADISKLDASGSSVDTTNENDSFLDTWSAFDSMVKRHRANTKIGHINANSIAGFKFHEIKNWLMSGRFDILLITETKIDASFSSSQFKVEGFRMYRVDRNIYGGGLMVFIRNDICFHVITRFNIDMSSFRTESMILKVKINKSWFAVVGIYRPPNIPKSQWKLELSAIFEAATAISNDAIFLGDFNCDMLEPNKPPMDGRDLCDLLDIYNLKNLITTPTRITETTRTLLDLILTSNKNKILSSGVVDVQISDHSLVYAVLRLSAPRLRSRKICLRSLKNFDSNVFLEDLHNVPFHIMDIFDDVDDKLFVFESLYLDIVNEHAPLKNFHVRGNQVPFMTEQWRKAIRHRNKLWKKFTHDRTDAHYALYKEQRNKCTSLRRKAIKAYFLRKSETANPNDFWNTYRPFLQSKKSKQANDILLEEKGELIKNKKDTAEVFNNYFIHIADAAEEVNQEEFGTDFNSHPSIASIQRNHYLARTSDFDFEFTNATHVEKIIQEINARKSCGHDMIPPRLVKESASAIAEPLTNIVNSSITQCQYPSRWKMGQVTPLFKKDNEFCKENYRPVTVLPTLNNIFERILAKQLETFYQNILSDFISAYRRRYSCETSLLRLTEDWRKSRDNKEIVAVVSMDLSKAFDSIPHTLLLAKLKAYGLSGRSIELLRSYLDGRWQRVKIGDTFSNWELVRRGVPQGSVLGPMFFNVFINDLFYFIEQVNLNAYADDEQLYSSDKDPETLDRRLKHELLIANSWYKRNGMIANPDKHQAMVLGNTDHDFSFPVKNSIDLLGVSIDNELSFNCHISNICEKVNNQFNVLKRFKSLITRNIILRLYKAFVLPHFQYCSLIWHFSGTRNCDKLESLNKRILRFVFNDTKSCYEELLKKAKITSLYDGRIHKMLIVVFKSLFDTKYPNYLKELFSLRNSKYQLRGKNILTLPKARTTRYGLDSIRYQAARIWNSLSDSLRVLTSLKEFKNTIKKLEF